MATEKFANFTQTTLTATLTSSTNPITVASASGFPTAPQYRVLIDNELLLVTGGAGTTSWTVTRGVEGTTAAGHNSGATVTGVLTAGAMDQTRLDNLSLSLCNGRLTLQSGTPVPTTDQTAKTTLYFTPYQGSRIAVFNGSEWLVDTFSEISIAVPSTTTTPFDVFAYDNAGALTLETANWTNDTTRATALTTQDGVYVKSGATTRRYLGTCRTTGTSGQCEDSLIHRLCWNYYNRVNRGLYKTDATTHTYSTASYRQWNANTANQVDWVIGLVESDLLLVISGALQGAGSASYFGLGVNNTVSTNLDPITSTVLNGGASCLNWSSRLGYSYAAAVELGGSAPPTFYSFKIGGYIPG